MRKRINPTRKPNTDKGRSRTNFDGGGPLDPAASRGVEATPRETAQAAKCRTKAGIAKIPEKFKFELLDQNTDPIRRNELPDASRDEAQTPIRTGETPVGRPGTMVIPTTVSALVPAMLLPAKKALLISFSHTSIDVERRLLAAGYRELPAASLPMRWDSSHCMEEDALGYSSEEESGSFSCPRRS